jgi:hypothetical protein
MHTSLRKVLICFNLTMLYAVLAHAQMTDHAIQVSGGYSVHGTGDLQGFVAEVGYDHVFTRRLDWTNALTTTIHSGKDAVFAYPGAPSPGTDRGANFTTAGFQLTSMGHFAPISARNQKVKLGGGVILRYQSSSMPDGYGIYTDPSIFPEPFYVFFDPRPGNIYTIGYTFGITWEVRVSQKFAVGLKAMFQNDTNGDAITSLSLQLGRLLPRR